MPKILREHYLAKIAEIEQKIADGLEPDMLAEYYLMLACWRWLAARAVDESERETLRPYSVRPDRRRYPISSH